MTNTEYHCVWEILTKQIDDLKPRVHAAYDEWSTLCNELEKLERERNKIWREKVNDFGKSLIGN